jgi:hypothetical protein
MICTSKLFKYSIIYLCHRKPHCIGGGSCEMHRQFTQPSLMLSHFFLPRNKIQHWNGTHFTNKEPLPKRTNQSQTKLAWGLSSSTFWNNKSYYKLVIGNYRIFEEALLQVWMSGKQGVRMGLSQDHVKWWTLVMAVLNLQVHLTISVINFNSVPNPLFQHCKFNILLLWIWTKKCPYFTPN